MLKSIWSLFSLFPPPDSSFKGEKNPGRIPVLIQSLCCYLAILWYIAVYSLIQQHPSSIVFYLVATEKITSLGFTGTSVIQMVTCEPFKNLVVSETVQQGLCSSLDTEPAGFSMPQLITDEHSTYDKEPVKGRHVDTVVRDRTNYLADRKIFK